MFSQSFDLIKQGKHLTENGLSQIISLKSSLNLGLSENLKLAFPSVTPIKRPQYEFKEILNPNWISGFVSGEGSFHILNRSTKAGSSNILFARFSIHLNIRDLEVLNGISKYFNNITSDIIISPRPSEDISSPSVLASDSSFKNEVLKKIFIKKNSVELQISKLSDIVEILIPFFQKYPLLGVKNLDFLDFVKICEMLLSKKYLTSNEEFNNLIKIKSNMNLNRKA